MTDRIDNSAEPVWSIEERLAALELDRDALQRRINIIETHLLEHASSLTTVTTLTTQFAEATAAALQALDERCYRTVGGEAVVHDGPHAPAPVLALVRTDDDHLESAYDEANGDVDLDGMPRGEDQD